MMRRNLYTKPFMIADLFMASPNRSVQEMRVEDDRDRDQAFSESFSWALTFTKFRYTLGVMSYSDLN